MAKDYGYFVPKVDFGKCENVDRYKKIAQQASLPKQTIEEKVDNLWVENKAPDVLEKKNTNLVPKYQDKFDSKLQAPVKQDLEAKIGKFFKVTLPQTAEDLWDDIKEPFVGKSEKQLLTEAKLSPKLLVEDAKNQLAKENPTREDYALVKQTQDVIKKYGTDESNIRAISEDTTQLQKDLERAEKTWQASPVDATVANAGAAVTGIFGNLSSFANSLGADKIPLLKEVTNFAVDGARKAQENAQQYNKGDYGEALGTVTQGVVNLVPYFLIGTGSTAVKGATTVSKYGKYIEPIIKNPSFWYSLTSMWGQKYQEKLDEGYNRFQALGNAILYAFPASLIEVSGGIGAKGKEAQSLLRTMGEEIAEEIAQDIMSGVSDKITTNHDLPVFSMTEDAIINPKQLGKTALYTAPIVVIGGGANNVINNSVNNRIENQKAQAQINQDLQSNKNVFNEDFSELKNTSNVRNVLQNVPKIENLQQANRLTPQNVAQNQNAEVQLENVKGLPEISVRKLLESQNNKRPNITLPKQAEMAQNANMEQITQMPNLPTQKAQETLQSAKIAGMTDMDIQKAKELNDMLRSGTRLKFYDPQNIPQGVDVSRAADANGFYMDGTLWINKNSEMKVERILGHELTHHVENDDLINTILDSNIFYDFLSEKGFSNTAEFKKYLMEKKGYKQEELTSEMVAHFAEEKLFGKEETINRLARENRTLAQKILNWLSDLRTKIAGSTEAKELLKIENMYRKALDQARNTAYNTTDVKYNIKNIAEFDENEYNNIQEMKLSPKEYGKLAHIVDTDPTIKPGKNYVETSDATYVIYQKEYNDFKVVDKYEGGADNDTIANGNIRGIDEARYGREGFQNTSTNTPNEGTTKSNDELLNGNKGARSVKIESNRNGISDKKSVAGKEPAFSMPEKDVKNYLEENSMELRANGSLVANNLTDKQIKDLVKIYKANGYEDVSTDYLVGALQRGSAFIPRAVADVFIEKQLGYKPQYDTTKIYEDAEGNKLTKEQVEFYKDSAVRDIRGRLIPVYHKTDSDFYTFDKKAGTRHGKKYGAGFYFSITPENYGNREIKVYLNAREGEFKYVPKQGYYIVQEPNQIKNVDNTNPTENPDIRYSMNPVEVAKNISKSQESSLLNEIAPIDDKKLETVEEKETTASILTKSPKRPAKDLLKQSVDVVMRKLVDAGNTINTVGKLTGDKHLYEYFNNTKQARQSAEYMIGEAQTDIKGNRVGNSLIRIFEEVRSKGDAYTNEFFEYLLHMHNIDRMAQNKPVFGASVTAEDSRKIANQLLEKHPEFEKQANKVYAYNRNLMQWRVDSGLISKEQADLMNEMYPHYVPTFRDVSGTSGSRVMQGTVQIANTVRKATGSNKDIMPIDASMARQTMQTVQAAKRNLLGNRLLNDALNNKDKVGEYIQAVEKTTEQNDLETELDTPKDTNLDSNNNVFKIFRNGETYVMQVNNGIYEGLKSISSEIDNTDTNLLLNAAKKANTTFKQLITGYSPMFTIRNFARDIQDAGLYSRNLREFLKKYPKAYAEMTTNGKMWQLYKSLGGTGSSFFDYETGIEKTLDTKNKTSTKIKEATLGKVEELNMMIEQAPRFAEFMGTIEKAGNQNYDTLMEAMLNAADITVNFGRSGTWTKALNSTFVPFLNPSVQGFDKFARTVLESRDGKQFAKLAVRATLLGILPSVINELIYWDDDEYENLSDRDKDTNFLIKTGDNKWVKIPKGRVLSIFGNAAARGLRTLKGEKWDVGEFLKNQASQTAPISVFDSNLYSPIQAVQNNKTWYGSDIVPQRLQDYAPKDQYDENTDVFSKWLGGKINYSPKKINYLIDAYTGIIGDVVLPLTTPKAETNPFTKAFVLDGVTSNEISNDFYNMMDEYNTKRNPKKSAKEVSRYLNKQSKQVSDIYKEIREVENSDISDNEKRKRVRELRELANTIELTAMATVPEYEKAVDKYRGTFADEDVDSDYAYLFANRDVFGAEYAVKTFSKSLYNNHKDENMNTFFRNYFTREYFQKKLEPKETTKTPKNTLPTLKQQRAKLPTLKK